MNPDSLGYRVVVVSADHPDLVADFAAELARLALAPGGTKAPIDVTTSPDSMFSDPRPSDPTTALVVIGGPKTATDASIAAAVHACRESMRICVPVFDPSTDFPSQMPRELHELNGVPWIGGASAGSPATVVLRLLGITESERKVFISYRRTDATQLAHQIRYGLIDAGWEVFLDRFSVPPAAVFQEQLDRDLADKAFVLLLESPDAITSQWVEHEIAFAHMNKFGLMALSLPETAASEEFPAVLEDLRLRLTEQDVEGDVGSRVLTPLALERVLVEIDVGHASAFQQRREILMLDASAELARAGFDVRVIGDWALLGSNDLGDEVLLATPRAPEPRDLLAVDSLMKRVRVPGRRARGWVVHPLEDIDRDRALLLAWLSRHRRVGPSPVMLLGSRVGK